jgi:hypothetical protein|tara:strand:- start:227 stop:487 length:261 start_codon:yes stop_codon:yes gene_type:complete
MTKRKEYSNEIEIKKFKKELIKYFKKPNFDVTLKQLFEDLKLNLEKLNLLQYCLDELVKKEWIIKESSFDHFEYDPGKKLDYGGIH